MELFYQLNLQEDQTTAYEIPVDFEITDSAFPVSEAFSTSFILQFAPKGTYVPKVLEIPEEQEAEPVSNITNSTKNDTDIVEIEPEPTPEPTPVPTPIPIVQPTEQPTAPVVREVRKNQPITVLEHKNAEEMFAKTEPTIHKLQIDKTGNVEMKFSSEMVYPDNWVQKYQ